MNSLPSFIQCFGEAGSLCAAVACAGSEGSMRKCLVGQQGAAKRDMVCPCKRADIVLWKRDSVFHT